MSKKGIYLIIVMVIVVFVVGISFVLKGGSNTDTPQKPAAFTQEPGESAMQTSGDTEAMEQTGASAKYVPFSDAALADATSEGRAVLFFAALAWCPTCQTADKDLQANLDKIPADVTVLRVDYDNDSASKQKYNVVVQDTFVQVDEAGQPVAVWNSGGRAVETINANVI